MAVQTEERRLALRASRRSQLDLWFVGWLVGWLVGWFFGSYSITSNLLSMKMEQMECSETSAIINQTPGNYPKEDILNTIFNQQHKILSAIQYSISDTVFNQQYNIQSAIQNSISNTIFNQQCNIQSAIQHSIAHVYLAGKLKI
jgi:hypothetical protein